MKPYDSPSVKTGDALTRRIEASVQDTFSERIYFRLRRNSTKDYIWEHLSELPTWVKDLGIGPGGSVLSRVHVDNQDTTLAALEAITTEQSAALRLLTTFCGPGSRCVMVRMGLVPSDEDKVDGYFEREEQITTRFSIPWFASFLGRLDISYTLLDRDLNIVDFNSRSNDYAKALFGCPLVPGKSILSYASEQSKPILIHDLEHSFNGDEIRREWEDETDSQGSVFCFVYLPIISAAGITEFVAMCTLDLTRQRSLERHQKQLAVAVARSPISVVITDAQGLITYVNPFFEQLTGYASDEVLGRTPRLLQSDQNIIPVDFKNMWDTLLSGDVWTGEFHNRRKDGSEYDERAILVPIFDDTKNLDSIVGLKEDITELRHTMQQLQEKEEHFRTLFDSAGAAIYIHDTAGYIRDVNPMASMQTGYTRDELIGMHVGKLDAGSGNAPPPQVVELLSSEPSHRAHHVDFETIERRKDGTEFPAEVRLFVFSSHGEDMIAANVVDATERQNQMTRIRQSAEEKAVLLRELHHRVKNNLQSIASLLRLQIDVLRDHYDRELFETNIGRIMSMAAAHAMLHETGSLTEIDLSGYLDQLAHYSLDWSATKNKPVSITVTGKSVTADIEQAVPFGLIANELIMNTIQDHSEHDSPQDITVTIDTDGDRGELKIRDNRNAKGTSTLSEGEENESSFSATLIDALSKQIDGKLHVPQDSNVHFHFTFSPKLRGLRK